MSELDQILINQGWNIRPAKDFSIASGHHVIESAARAIAVSAYPQLDQLISGGKAHKYADALVAYLFRISKITGKISKLPTWVRKIKIERLQARLFSGNRNLLRSFVVRDLVNAALINKMQFDQRRNGERSTFTIRHSPDLTKIKFEIPFQPSDAGLQLIGKIPETETDSLRAAIKEHASALAPFTGPSPRVEGADEEYFYQNTMNRFVRPVLQTAHIRQIVWSAANQYQEEASARKLPIDQVLMRKAIWATDLFQTCAKSEHLAIMQMQSLGLTTCSCKLIHIGPP